MKTKNQTTLLLCDNTPEFLEMFGDFLESNGYMVKRASNRKDVTSLIESTRIHMAILDLRLENDNDEKDRSGLQIAQQLARKMPKLILTKFPVYQDVVEALRLDHHKLPPAVDFVDKRHGFHHILEAVQAAEKKYLPFNWELQINWQDIELSQILAMINPALLNKNYEDHSEELLDHFRDLFASFDQISIGSPLLKKAGALALPVIAFNATGTESQYLVMVGQPDVISREKENFKKVTPPPYNAQFQALQAFQETAHFASSAYIFSSCRLEDLVSLSEAYWRYPLTAVLQTVDHLYQHNLVHWHQEVCPLPNQTQYDAYYDQLVGKTVIEKDAKALQQKITAIGQQAMSARLIEKFKASQTQISYYILDAPANELLNFNNPVNQSDLQHPLLPNSMAWGYIHGCVDTKRVLGNMQSKSWIIDFSNATQGLLLFDFVNLEVSIRFERINTRNIWHWHQMNVALCEANTLNNLPEETNFPDDIEKAFQMIKQIRLNAYKQIKAEKDEYDRLLFACVLRRLSTFDLDQRYPRQITSSYWQAVQLTAVLASQLFQSMPMPAQAQNGFWLDLDNKVIWVEGRRIEPTPQEFDIIMYLYERAGQLCERRAIVEEALGEPYDEFDPEQSRLNSAMSRLRQKIEQDPRNARYLLTVRGHGYRLVLNTLNSTH